MSSSCCGGDSVQITPNPAQSTTDTSDDASTTCPVMPGSPVVKSAAEAQGFFRDHEGQRYWFCCAACGPLFDADPAKYAAVA